MIQLIKDIFIGDRRIHTLKFGNLTKSFTQLQPVILTTESNEYSETGNWTSSSLLGYGGTPTKYSGEVGSTAKWALYPPGTGNYDVFVWYPFNASVGGANQVKYTIDSLGGTWRSLVDQSKNHGTWNKIATVSAVAGTVISVILEVMANNTRVNALKLVRTPDQVDEQYDPSENQDTTTVAIFANQSGYDTEKPKRATITNVAEGTPFTIKKSSDDTIVYSGSVTNQIADFSNFKPSTTEEYHLECSGQSSHNFSIGKYWMQRVSINPALRFMDESRQDTFNLGGMSGYGWRDSHQFSFELNSLVLQYMANPSAYERMPYGISNLETCEYPELRVQNEPDIIWLMKFGAMRYYDFKVNHGYHLHALIKAQLAYFLYIYPEISEYVSEELYTQVRDMTIEEWGNLDCTLQWYEIAQTPDNNLFEVQNYVGDIKGQKPPGYAITPNLLMYEVAKRDGLENYQDFFNAAYANCEWLINEIDLDDPKYTKGQRMSEWITIEGLTFFQEMYTSQAPSGLLDKINRWADVMISRSNNIWDLRKYSDPKDVTESTVDQWTGGLNQYNEVGNVAGFQAITYATSRVISDENKKKRLKEIGIAQIDNVFGRNPFGRHYSYDAPREIEGVDVGWFSFYKGGMGDLELVPGTLDGAPKESAYPFNPTAPYGYTEGWVAFNTAWNASLAYSAADDIEIKAFDSAFANEITSSTVGSTIGIRLKAPLNFNENTAENCEITIKDNIGNEQKLSLIEASPDDYYFKGMYTVPESVTLLEISYGIGIFKKRKIINIA